MSIGGAIAGAGQLISGIAANRAGKASQQILNQEAQDTSNAGVAQELQLRDSARQAIGQQVASQSSNGFMGGSGSAIDALHQSQVNTALDVLNLRRTWSSKADALRVQGEQARETGRNALVGSLFSAAASVAGSQGDWASAKSGQIDSSSGGSSGGSADSYDFNNWSVGVGS